MPEKSEETDRSKRMGLKHRKKLVDSLITSEAPSLQISTQVESVADSDLSQKSPSNAIDFGLSQTSTSNATEYDILKSKLEEMQKENAVLKKNLKEYESQIKTLKDHIMDVERQIKNDNVGFEDKVKSALKDFLSPNQVEILLKKKTKARWTQEELSRAFTLRYARIFVSIFFILNYF